MEEAHQCETDREDAVSISGCSAAASLRPAPIVLRSTQTHTRQTKYFLLSAELCAFIGDCWLIRLDNISPKKGRSCFNKWLQQTTQSHIQVEEPPQLWGLWPLRNGSGGGSEWNVGENVTKRALFVCSFLTAVSGTFFFKDNLVLKANGALATCIFIYLSTYVPIDWLTTNQKTNKPSYIHTHPSIRGQSLLVSSQHRGQITLHAQ